MEELPSANGKRKRDDPAPSIASSNAQQHQERKRKERKTRARQEEMLEEFSATYHGPTTLYKLLEIRHLENPWFLPRTLSYRLKLKASKKKAAAKKAKNKLQKPTLSGSTLKDWKISMKSETMEMFKSDNKRIGMLISGYYCKPSKAKFDDKDFELMATCLLSMPCTKDVRLGREWLREDAQGIYLLVFQVVDVGAEMSDKLAAQNTFAFTSAPRNSAKVKGRDLLKSNAVDCAALFSYMLRMNALRRRTGTVNVDLEAVGEDTVKGVVKVQFRMVWDKAPRDHQSMALAHVLQEKLGSDFLLNGKQDLSSILSIPKAIDASVTPSDGKDTTVWFHYLYHNLLRRMSEKRQDYSCVLCNMYAGSLEGLVEHLVCSHHRFTFQVSMEHDNVPHIYVTPSSANAKAPFPIFDPKVHGSVCEVRIDSDSAIEPIEHEYVYVSKKSRAGRLHGSGRREELSGRVRRLFEELKDQPTSFFAPLFQRQYFHSRTGAVVLEHEKDYDSDDDVDEEWIIKQSEKLLDEFEDVALEEKEFMKMWNRHVKQNKILADFMVASSCRLFAKQHGKWLLEHGLRYNFLLHLFNLWDNSLLNARAIIDCMLIVDNYAALQAAAK